MLSKKALMPLHLRIIEFNNLKNGLLFDALNYSPEFLFNTYLIKKDLYVYIGYKCSVS